MRPMLAFLLLVLSPAAFGGPPFPLPDDSAEYGVAQEISDFETLYSYKTSKTIPELFDFYKAQLSPKGWTATNRIEQDIGSVPNGQIRFFHKEDGQSINLIAHYESYPNGKLTVAVYFVTDLKAAVAFHERRKGESTSQEVQQPALQLSFEKELDAIREAINARDIEGLLQLSSPWFTSNYAESFIKKQLENLYVRELFPMYATKGSDLGVVIVKFDCGNGSTNELGFRVMYFDRIEGDWKFNGLPFEFLDIAVPSHMTRKFSENE